LCAFFPVLGLCANKKSGNPVKPASVPRKRVKVAAVSFGSLKMAALRLGRPLSVSKKMAAAQVRTLVSIQSFFSLENDICLTKLNAQLQLSIIM
jgi:hypothetical protein